MAAGTGRVQQAMSRPASRRQHQQFCETEGWEIVRNAQGQAVRHHITYRLHLADGRILRTRISRPANNETYGPQLWSTILGPLQLDVSESAFWDCVDHGVTPPRPGAAPPIPSAALPAELVYQLLHKLQLTEEEVGHLNLEQAVAKMSEYWSKPPSD
ncbi:MAG: cytotoxic translational repressor of toxin-antitoxin stability system [Sporichthyaceae bacterium]